MDRMKKDGTPAKKPGRKPVVAQAAAEEEKAAPITAAPITVEKAQDAAWRRIYELADAIQGVRDEKEVSKWANEITWQCVIIGEFNNYDGQTEAGN